MERDLIQAGRVILKILLPLICKRTVDDCPSGLKLSDKLNARAGYYWADINGSSTTQNIKAGTSYDSSKGLAISFDYKMGKYTLLGEYVSSNLTSPVNMPSNPKGWAVQSYRSVDPGAFPAGAGGFDTTAVAKPGSSGSGIFPNTTGNLNVLFLAYQKVLATNVIGSLEYQDLRVKNMALSNWTTKNIDKTYMMKLEFFY